MIFQETELQGVFLINIEKKQDERGFFARSWCASEFTERNLDSKLVQSNISHNSKKGTIRGLHYQSSPFEESKLVSCTKGELFDVVVDIRPDSPTFCKWISVVLSSSEYNMIYIPGGYAHGFQTLEDNTDVFYQMSEFFFPECSRGYRWNDPAFGIKWPLPCSIISDRDKSYNKIIVEGEIDI
ncbi:MAG: dTDP-4-dehydrorhamnose 3,5-epimerase [Clostridiaceae bacterium]|jgi:dTDP-4-dehydrorhamnose 3,5-epimerase|nr:dTDP-4-dehydrorhamnose 3,5-epimerase [Clostridiaceae bacterium]